MAARNPDSAINQGEFHARKPPTESEHHKHGSHQPGRQSSPTSRLPTYHATTLPQGHAPPEHTFPPQNAYNYTAATSEPLTEPLTFPGATSSTVHTGLGLPIKGQTSSELHHHGERAPGRGHEKIGLARYGKIDDRVHKGDHDLGFADPRIDERQRALDNEEARKKMPRGDKGSLGAEDLPPSSA